MGSNAEQEYELDQIAEDVEFTREAARELYRAQFGDSNLIARWDRIRSAIPFEDVVEEIQGERRSVISCPFHGRDSRPSFTLYRRTNDAFCFGCPEGEKYYDAVRFVCAKWGYTRLQAIAWLEKHWELPPLAATDTEEEEDDEDDSETVTVTLNFSHLAESYIAKAATTLSQKPDPEMAREFIAIFFQGRPDKDADPNSDESLERVMPMARVLGWKAIEEIKRRRLR